MRVNLPVTDQKYVLREDEILVSRTTPKGVITYASDAFVPSSGFTSEELLGQAAVGVWAACSLGRTVGSAVDICATRPDRRRHYNVPTKGAPELLRLFRMLDQMNGKLDGVLRDVRSSTGSVVNQMDRMTQQDAGLVGDSAESANLLAAQAKLLGEALSIFQLGESGAAPKRVVRQGRREVRRTGRVRGDNKVARSPALRPTGTDPV